MRLLARVGFGFALGVLVVTGLLLQRVFDVPDPSEYEDLFAPEEPAPPPGSVTATFLGVATLLLSDGETSLMTDGFFTRPPLRKVVLGKIEPDREVIAQSLARAGVDELAAVIPVHSHYDHAMDAPEVARLTGALLVGSESTANVGRGWGLPERQIRVAQPGETLRFGAFTLRLVESVHAPLPALLSPDAGGRSTIDAPLVPPASAYDYKLGKAYSVWIGHPRGNVLVQGSAGFVPGALAQLRADVVFLGLGGLGSQTPEFREAYFREVVATVGATRVIPIHWDDFGRPLSEPLRPNLNLGGGFRVELEFLRGKAAEAPGLRLALLPAWRRILLFPPASAAAR